MGKEELPLSVPGEETVACLLGRQQRKLCRDRTYKDSLSPLQIKVPPSFGWGSVLLSVPRSLLLGLSLRSGPSSLLLSPLPIRLNLALTEQNWDCVALPDGGAILQGTLASWCQGAYPATWARV